ncbi:MAG TPA: HEAT repeat domain-containing protein [Bacteriovoracaceae bacterium]|nr:HEAT repeat domain-containing protein [Bacteriovoracaceae bacterium]
MLGQFTLYESMGLFIAVLGAALVVLMTVIMIRKYFIAITEKITNSKRDFYRQAIASIIEGEDFNLLKDLPRNERLDIRNIISDMVPNLIGHSFERVQQLYSFLELDLEDQSKLKHIDHDKRLRALNRLEKLKMMIPYDLHLELLDDSNEEMRLLAVLLLIHNYKHQATPVLISFLQQKKYGKKGYLFYIIQEIGKVDKAAIPFLFSRVTDPDFEEAMLMSANMSPPPRFDDVIYRKLNKSSHPFVIVWALRVLMHYPSKRLFALVEILKDHHFWAVRLEVVRTLHLFEPSTISPFLEALTKDANYLVRLEATQFTAKDFELNKDLLNKIILDETHPAKNILCNLFSVEDLKAA